MWYSLNDRPWDPNTGEGFNGALFDYQYPQYPGVITPIGINFREYTDALLSNKPPVNGTISPSSGGALPGTTVHFATTWKDSNGWNNLKSCLFHIGTTTAQAHNVFLCYNVQTNKLMIRSNDGTKWWGGYAPGSVHFMQNDQAVVDCNQTTVEHVGSNWVKVTWAISFKPAFRGQKNTYLKAMDKWLLTSRWQRKGTWTIY